MESWWKSIGGKTEAQLEINGFRMQNQMEVVGKMLYRKPKGDRYRIKTNGKLRRNGMKVMKRRGELNRKNG